MLGAAQEPLHGHTKISQLDAIARLMAVKSQFTLSRDVFDVMLTVIGTLLPEGHILPKSMYEAQKLLRALKMPYEQYMHVRRDASCLGKNMRKQSTVQSVNLLGS